MKNEKFVAYGTVVKIFAILKSPCAKGCYLIQKLEPVNGRVCLPQCFAIFFSSLTCWRYEDFKDLVIPCATEKMCCIWDTTLSKSVCS